MDKKIHSILKTTFLMLWMLSLIINKLYAQQSKKEKGAAQEVALKSMVEARSYTFEVSAVSSMGGRTRQQSPGFSLKISKDSLISYLPYFGQATSPSISLNNGGINFTSVNFIYTITNSKKGGWDISIKPKDVKDVQQMFLTIFDNGNASLSITPSNRQPVSYSGYIDSLK